MLTKNEGKSKLLSFGGIKPLEKIILAKHLAIALKAGLDIVEALDALAMQTTSKRLRDILGEIRKNVEGGQPLAESFMRYPKDFPSIFVDMIYSGERGGTLPENLEYLSIQLEKDYELKKKIKGALMYPGIIFFATIIVTLSLSIFVLPKITDLYDSFGDELPLVTSIVLGAMRILRNYWYLIIAGLIGVSGLYTILGKIPVARKILDKVKLGLPVFGNLYVVSQISRLSRTLGTLVKSGVPIQAALESLESTANNLIYKDLIRKTSGHVGSGETLYSILKEYPKLIPPLASRMISLGEKTGNLESNLLYLGEFYEKELDGVVKNMATILEPILLIFVGLMVGLVAVAIIMPIYSLSGSISRFS
ncbi:MAG: type II secretion system F family protein [Candidatus Dojkabacteria bacterium]|nr:type II secretion system F family protein [Candidatus Dojkabacteria bacterium]